MSERGQIASKGIDDAIDDAIDHDDAWARLVLREYAPAVGALLRSRYRVFNAEDIEDVVIIALARLWKVRDRFDPKKASLKTFFFRIADNVARDVVKSGWYRARNLEVWLEEEQVSRADSGQPSAEMPDAQDETTLSEPASERILDLRAILARLPHTYRTIVLADAAAPGRVASAEFLSQELQIPTGAIRVYRHRAMKAIRTALERAGYKLP